MRRDDLAVLLAVGLLALLACFPFLNNSGLPAMTDAELHVLRIAEMGYSIQQGTLYPRWAPDFYYGYGYPIFNYYAPLSYHLGYYISLANPQNAAIAAKLLFIAASFLGAYGAYFLAKDSTSRGGGLLGAAAFCFSPYIQLINPHSRGDLAEVVALGFLPWVLYFWQRLWRRPSKSVSVWAVVFSSATLLSHNLTGLTMLVILALMAVWQWAIVKNTGHIKWIFATALVFIMLTAFFWLPFLAERNAVLLDVAGEGHYDYHHHFISLRELLQVNRRFDYKDATMSAPFSAGLIQVILALLGGAAGIIHRKRQIIFYVLLSVLFFFMITPWSLPFWESLPGIAFYQFPWRFLGPLAALMVPLVANCAEHLTSIPFFKIGQFEQSLVKTAAVGLLIIVSLPLLYPIPWTSGFGNITQLSLIQAELQGRWRGTTSTNDFVPATVDMLPGPTQSVIDSYKNPPVDRVNRFTLPDGVTVDVLADRSNHFAISTDQNFLLRLYLFYFPGWRAYVDGVEVEISIAHPEGFITVDIPQGTHDVVLSFQNSLSRSLSWWMSAFGLLLGVGGLWLIKTPALSLDNQKDVSYNTVKPDLSIVLILGLVVIITLINLFILKPGEMMYYFSDEGIAQPAQRHLSSEFEQPITLLGYDYSGLTAEPGDAIEIQLYWKATDTISDTYQSFVHVMLPTGQILTQSDHLNPGGYPTNLWPSDRYIRDKHVLTLPDTVAPGMYTINVGLYSLNTGIRLNTVAPQTGEITSFVTLTDTVLIRR